MERIYALKCKNGCFYIGKTTDIDRRFSEHLEGTFGSEWTRLHSPIEVVENIQMDSKFDEMKKTLEYMDKYGIEKVRGAQWCTVNLTKVQLDEIKRNINTDGCYRCGEKGHFANECSSMTKQRTKRKLETRSKQCDRCGSENHSEGHCYAKYDLNGKPLECLRCGRDSHFDEQCYATYDIDGNLLDCVRCGRDSHTVENCYATIDIDGRRIHSKKR